MIPFAALFRFLGLRINEYGRKTLELVVGPVAPPWQHVLTFGQHLLISWAAAIPLLLLLRRSEGRRARLAIGLAYGAAFYVVVNSWGLPLYFGDPTPWTLGFATVLPSLAVHLVYGAGVGLAARLPGSRPRSTV